SLSFRWCRIACYTISKTIWSRKSNCNCQYVREERSCKKHGADYLIDYTKDNWENELETITEGNGVDLALEMVGGSVFHKTRKSLAEFGRLVVFGVASGEQVKFYPTSLMGKNQAVIGFFLPQIMKRTELYKKGMEDLLSYVDSGKIKLTIGGTYSL